MSSTARLELSLQELSLATNNFHRENIIGRGGYGPVYRGQSEQHGMLAIKQLEYRSRGGQGDHEYGMEVTLLSKYKHENLVSLVGFCREDGQRILVYKYEANHSLDRFLSSKDLPWMRRLEICLGAARGLRYLHGETGSEHGVIHRDIKSSNILLDENWNAKISDFGLSRVALTKSADSFCFTVACGTLGYIDPEYIIHGTLTQKSDVYSFGIVLFEVLFGKLVTTLGNVGDGRRFTAEMAKKNYDENTLDKMIGADLRKEMNSASLSKFSTIAYECLKNHREDRPTMSLVVEALEKALGSQQVSSRKSSELSLSGFMHDVYISSKVKFGSNYFAELLREELEGEGLSVYKGNISMIEFHEESVLKSAIKQSRSFIIVFSKNFATNFWNMQELREIIKCMKERGKVVLPVYIDVYLSDVREQKGYFGETMSRYGSQACDEVLVEATNVPGLQLLNFTDERDLAKGAAAMIKRQLLENPQKDN